MNKISIEMDRITAHVALEALTNEINRWRDMTEESVGEDALADYGNDMIHLISLYEELKEKAVKEYGDCVIDFTRGQE